MRNSNRKQRRFIMVFFDNMPNKIELTSIKMYLLSHIETNNTLIVSKHLLDKISKKHNESISTIKKAIISLKKDMIIIPIERGLYMVNPLLFTRVNTKSAMLESFEKQWEELKFKYVLAMKDAEIEKLKGKIIINKVNGILNENK